MATKIDEIDFSEFVVRHDCPPYSESTSVRPRKQAPPQRSTLVPVLLPRNQGQCPSPLHPRRSYGPVAHENRPAEIGTREPILQTPHICYIDEARLKCAMNSLPKNYVANKAICDAKPGCMWDPKAKVAGGPYGNQQPAITDKSLLRTWPC